MRPNPSLKRSAPIVLRRHWLALVPRLLISGGLYGVWVAICVVRHDTLLLVGGTGCAAIIIATQILIWSRFRIVIVTDRIIVHTWYVGERATIYGLHSLDGLTWEQHALERLCDTGTLCIARSNGVQQWTLLTPFSHVRQQW